MKAGYFSLVVLVPLLLCLPANLLSAETALNAKSADKPDARRPFRELSPEEREARFAEMQEKFGPAPFTLDELRRMPPEERQAKMRQWREGRLSFTPEEWQKRRSQIRQRLIKQIAELQKQKAAGTISEEQRLRLQRLELIASRFDRLSPASNALGTLSKGSNTVMPAKKPGN